MDIDDNILNEKSAYVEINSHLDVKQSFFLCRGVSVEAPLDRIHLHVHKQELFLLLLVIYNSESCKIAQRQLTNQIAAEE